MNKRKVKAVTVEFEDRAERFEVEATFSESRNGRKGSSLEWTEYHITWVMYDKPKPVEPTKSLEELEKEWEAALTEKRKNPDYAGTADGRDYFYSQAPKPSQWDDVEAIGRKELPAVFKKVSAFPEFDISDLLEGYGNGSVHT